MKIKNLFILSLSYSNHGLTPEQRQNVMNDINGQKKKLVTQIFSINKELDDLYKKDIDSKFLHGNTLDEIKKLKEEYSKKKNEAKTKGAELTDKEKKDYKDKIKTVKNELNKIKCEKDITKSKLKRLHSKITRKYIKMNELYADGIKLAINNQKNPEKK